jgi:hypothetical protein
MVQDLIADTFIVTADYDSSTEKYTYTISLHNANSIASICADADEQTLADYQNKC